MTSARGAVYGPPAWTTVQQNVDLGAQAANAVTENNVLAGPFGPGTSPLAYPASIVPGGMFFSHCRLGAAGELLAGIANPTGAPVDPAPSSYVLGTARAGVHRENIPRSGFEFVQSDRLTLDLPNIGAGASAQVAAGAQLGDTALTDIVICSPTQVVAAGVAFSSAFLSGANLINVVAFNLTALGVDPASQDFDVTVLRGAAGAPNNPGRGRQGNCGRILGESFRVTIDHGAIAADGVLEATAVVAPVHEPIIAGPGVTAVPFPTAALPAGVGISHARVSADNTIAVALCDLTGAGIDPPAITYDVLVFRSGRDPLSFNP